MNSPATVKVKILDNEYQIACPPEEREGLVNAARYLDEKMRKIRSGGNVIGVDRVAVMAGLNIAHELLSNTRNSNAFDDTFDRLGEKITRALGTQSQLEL
jgi:cell division protein ZapA